MSRDLHLQVAGEAFADCLHVAVLQRHMPEVARGEDPLPLREEDDVGSVDAGDVVAAVIEVVEEALDVRFDEGSSSVVEAWA